MAGATLRQGERDCNAGGTGNFGRAENRERTTVLGEEMRMGEKLQKIPIWGLDGEADEGLLG
jgi:hypothetical protein